MSNLHNIKKEEDNDGFIVPRSSRTKVRRTWKINPKTQVVQNKKQYSRAKFKRTIEEAQKEFEE